MEPRIPDGASPFDDAPHDHLPCPEWVTDEPAPVAVRARLEDEPELDPPHHVHDLWIVLGLGEE